MNTDRLLDTVRLLIAADKGLLAMDESTPTCDKRFAALGIPQTEQARRAWRELIITTPHLSDGISGAILYDETIHQKTSDGKSFTSALTDAGILIGIKVDAGTTSFAGHDEEKVTEGLDGLGERLAGYAALGARFAKWRAVISIGSDLPSQAAIVANAHALARYASLAQQAGLVPIVEPEVLMEGDHTLARCAAITEDVLRTVFQQLSDQGVRFEAMLLKPNMVLPGVSCPDQSALSDIVSATVNCFLRTVPAAVPGIAFLSGGQSAELASIRLNAMNLSFKSRLPWALLFSYSRAIQQPALELWRGNAANKAVAQQSLLHRVRCNQAARRGEYNAATDTP